MNLPASLTALLEAPVVPPLARALLHSLWIGAAVAIALAVLLRLLRRAPSNVRYLIACTALLLCLVLPALTLIPWSKPAPAPATRVEYRPIPETTLLAPQLVSADTDETIPPPLIPPLLRPALVGAWVLGVAVLSLHHLGGWLYLQLARRSTSPVPPGWPARVGRLSAQLNVRRPVRLVDCPRLDVPAVIGALRPTILLPVAVLTGLPPSHLDALLAHELAHVRRHDYLVNLLQSLVETLMFYHPAVWWVSAQVRQEREHCCDDIAAAAVGSRVDYADALVALESLRPAPAVVPAASSGSLARRIRRLLDAPAPRAPRRRSAVAALLAVTCALTPLVLAQQQRSSASDQPTPERRVGVINVANTNAPVTLPATVVLSDVTPADLKAEPEDYRIAPNDLVTVGISDLTGPGVETVKSVRVAEKSGAISLPIIDQVKAVGLTESELQKAIAKTYQSNGVIDNAQISVTVAEARGRMFNVIGGGVTAGQYAIPQSDFRLLDALIAARARLDARTTGITVVRRTAGADARRIEIPPDRLLKGDLTQNLVIRPGDTLIVTGPAGEPEKKFVNLTVAPGQKLTLDGKPATWDDVDRHLKSLPAADRPHTVLTLAAATRDVTVEDYFNAQGRAMRLVQSHGLSHFSTVGIAQPSPTPATTAPAFAPRAARPAPGTYTVGGAVERIGVYTLPNTADGLSLKQALVSAGIKDDPNLHITLFRRDGDSTIVPFQTTAKDLFVAKRADILLRPGDDIHVSPTALPKDATTRPSPTYHIAGAVRRPGAYTMNLLPRPTVRQALTAAGGFEDPAKQHLITLTRRNPDHPEQTLLYRLPVTDPAAAPQLDLVLQPGDLLQISPNTPLAPPP